MRRGWFVLIQNNIFNGFELSDFEYFKKTELKDHIKLKRKLKSFASLIHEELDEPIKDIYADYILAAIKKANHLPGLLYQGKKRTGVFLRTASSG
jgi:hypothetical protein